jgi:hypothetical protein
MRAREWATGMAAAALLAIPATAQQPAPAAAPAPVVAAPVNVAPALITQEIDFDQSDRLTLPVYIGGRGPYAFVVDSGAERSVIARELAARLNLAGAGQARVIGIAETVMADLYHIDQLLSPDDQYGAAGGPCLCL